MFQTFYADAPVDFLLQYYVAIQNRKVLTLVLMMLMMKMMMMMMMLMMMMMRDALRKVELCADQKREKQPRGRHASLDFNESADRLRGGRQRPGVWQQANHWTGRFWIASGLVR